MTSFDLAGIIKKHGVIGVLCAWLVYTNMRLTDVEDKLYNCYDQSRFAAMSNRSLNSSIKPSEKIYAVLPERKRRSNEEVLV
jgi:hypothetical protein